MLLQVPCQPNSSFSLHYVFLQFNDPAADCQPLWKRIGFHLPAPARYFGRARVVQNRRPNAYLKPATLMINVQGMNCSGFLFPSLKVDCTDNMIERCFRLGKDCVFLTRGPRRKRPQLANTSVPYFYRVLLVKDNVFLPSMLLLTPIL